MTIKTQKIGVDLGSFEIKISNLSVDKKSTTPGPSLKFKALGRLGERRYFRSVKKNIQSYVEHYGYEKIDLYFSMSPNIEGATTATIMTLPSTEKKILEKAIQFEVEEQNIVDNLANHHYTWDTIETIDESESLDGAESTRLILTTINRDVIFEIAQLRSIKWAVKRVELQVNTFGRKLEGNAAVVDFGHKSSDIYIYKNGKIDDITELYFKGEELNESIQNILSTPSYSLAEKLKHKANTQFKSEDVISSAQSDLIKETSSMLYDESEQVVSEIKRIIRRFELKDTFDIVTIDAIYFVGAGTKLKGLNELLKKSFEYETNPLYNTIGIEEVNALESFEENLFQRSNKPEEVESNDHLEKMKEKATEIKGAVFDKLNIDKGDSSKDGVQYEESDVLTSENIDKDIYFTSAILSTLDSDNDLDLGYQKYLKYKFDFSSILVMTTAMALTLFLGIGPIDKAYNNNIDRLNESLESQRIEVGDLESSREELDTMKRENEELKMRVDSLNEEKKWFSEILYEIPEITPKEVIVEHVNINNGLVTINGYSTDYTDIGAFAIGLESLGDYEIVKIEDVNASDKSIGGGFDTDERKTGNTMTKKFKMTLQR